MKKILLKNATIYPITSEPVKNGDLLVENGKIKKIGHKLEADAYTKIIDCSEKYLLPGFIDVHTHLGLYDEGTGWAGQRLSA
jgi:imidazolonepropionase-like amidohydrolase